MCARTENSQMCKPVSRTHVTKSQISEESWKLLQGISKTVINVYFIIDFSKAFDCFDCVLLLSRVMKILNRLDMYTFVFEFPIQVLYQNDMDGWTRYFDDFYIF